MPSDLQSLAVAVAQLHGLFLLVHDFGPLGGSS